MKFPLILIAKFLFPMFFVSVVYGQNKQVIDMLIYQLHFVIERSDIKDAKKAFKNFVFDFEPVTKPKNLANGLYMAVSEHDDFGFFHTIQIRIVDQRIVAVEYNETDTAGISKRSMPEYCIAMERHQKGSSPLETFTNYEQQLLKLQDVRKIQAVSGATYSALRFQLAAVKALNSPKR